VPIRDVRGCGCATRLRSAVAWARRSTSVLIVTVIPMKTNGSTQPGCTGLSSAVTWSTDISSIAAMGGAPSRQASA
jgi:hypothetical protein